MDKNNHVTFLQLILLLDYNKHTGVFIWKQSRGKAKEGSEAGGITTTKGGYKYRCIGMFGRQYKAHRLAWLYMFKVFPKDQIDHINGDSLDNRLKNLRLASALENSKNRKIHGNNKSGVCGVVWHKRDQCWTANIKNGGPIIHLGYFDKIEDAISARREAEHRLGFHDNHGLTSNERSDYWERTT